MDLQLESGHPRLLGIRCQHIQPSVAVEAGKLARVFVEERAVEIPALSLAGQTDDSLATPLGGLQGRQGNGD